MRGGRGREEYRWQGQATEDHGPSTMFAVHLLLYFARPVIQNGYCRLLQLQLKGSLPIDAILLL